MSEVPPLVQVDLDDAHRTATIRIPRDLDGLPPGQTSAIIDAMVAARAEWEAKGYTIRYRSLT